MGSVRSPIFLVLFVWPLLGARGHLYVVINNGRRIPVHQMRLTYEIFGTRVPDLVFFLVHPLFYARHVPGGAPFSADFTAGHLLTTLAAFDVGPVFGINSA